MKRALLRLAKACGLFALSRWLTRRDLRILCYHGIWLGPGQFGDFLYMSADKFRERVRFLEQAPYPVVTLDAAVAGLADGSLPDAATVITIDDGWYGTQAHMVPALAKAGLPATLYSTTYYAETQQPVFHMIVRYMLSVAPAAEVDLSALGPPFAGTVDLAAPGARGGLGAQVIGHGERELDRAGRTDLARRLGELIGVDFATLDAGRVFHMMTLDELRAAPGQGIDVQLHTHRHHFPSGESTPAAFDTLRDLGIASVTTTEQGLVRAGANVYALPRLLDGESVDLVEFEAELSGFGDLVRRLRP